MSRARSRLSAVFIIFLLGGGMALAKVGFNDFTEEQQRWFWEKVDNYAYFESTLRSCGHNTMIEQRMINAARNCAKEKDVETARNVFRRKVIQYNKSKKSTLLCELTTASGQMANFKEIFDEAVRVVENACRSCSTC